MGTTLADGPFLGGEIYSLADAAATPYVNRLLMLGIFDPFLKNCPRVLEWFDRVRARDSFEYAITRWYSEDDADRFAPSESGSADKIKAILSKDV